MVAAAIQDIDGLGILFSEELYWELHHKLGHCSLFGMVVSSLLTTVSVNRLKVFPIYLGLFHLHLVMDYYGSGPGWGLFYLWPFHDWEWRNEHAWPFFSWQNLSTAGMLLVWMMWIVVVNARTPLETLMPALDRRFVAWVKGFRRADRAEKETAAKAAG